MRHGAPRTTPTPSQGAPSSLYSDVYMCNQAGQFNSQAVPEPGTRAGVGADSDSWTRIGGGGGKSNAVRRGAVQGRSGANGFRTCAGARLDEASVAHTGLKRERGERSGGECTRSAALSSPPRAGGLLRTPAGPRPYDRCLLQALGGSGNNPLRAAHLPQGPGHSFDLQRTTARPSMRPGLDGHGTCIPSLVLPAACPFSPPVPPPYPADAAASTAPTNTLHLHAITTEPSKGPQSPQSPPNAVRSTAPPLPTEPPKFKANAYLWK